MLKQLLSALMIDGSYRLVAAGVSHAWGKDNRHYSSSLGFVPGNNQQGTSNAEIGDVYSARPNYDWNGQYRSNGNKNNAYFFRMLKKDSVNNF